MAGSESESLIERSLESPKGREQIINLESLRPEDRFDFPADDERFWKSLKDATGELPSDLRDGIRRLPIEVGLAKNLILSFLVLRLPRSNVQIEESHGYHSAHRPKYSSEGFGSVAPGGYDRHLHRKVIYADGEVKKGRKLSAPWGEPLFEHGLEKTDSRLERRKVQIKKANTIVVNYRDNEIFSGSYPGTFRDPNEPPPEQRRRINQCQIYTTEPEKIRTIMEKVKAGTKK